MSSHLSGGKVNISLLEDLVKKRLLHLLEKCNGSKAIIWDDALEGLVALVARYQLLKERDVINMFHLVPGIFPPLQNVANVIFFTRPIVDHMNIIANYIKKREGKSPDAAHIKYHLFFLPRNSLICEQRLGELGVLGNFHLIESLDCNLFPFDDDIMSMEMELAYREYYLDGDPTCLYEVAQAILTLQDLYGVIPRVSGKGPCVQKVWDLVKRLSLEPRSKTNNQYTGSQISQLILIDRHVDVLTPLATQVTYEGLIDEIFGIKNTKATFPASKLSQDENEPNNFVADKKLVTLNSGDEVYAELRDKVFTSVGPLLSKKTKLISAQLASAQDTEVHMSVNKMKELVGKLPSLLKSKEMISTHMNIAELIKDVTDTPEFLDALHAEQEIFLGVDTDKALPFIENAIAHKKPILKVLRLICMQSFTNSGLKPKVLDYYKREIIQTYGFQHMLTLSNLEKAGLLCSQTTGVRPYTVLRKMLYLTIENPSDNMPSDINFAHVIYAPLSVRLVQRLTRDPNIIPQDLLALLPGPVVEEMQTLPTPRKTKSTSYNETPRVVLVFFIGGCTFAEISALRFLSQQEENNVEFIIATTNLTRGDFFVNSLMETL